jgi:hypothetical protein
MNDEMRKFFAGIVLPQLIAKSTMQELLDPEHRNFICATAYEYADVMLGITDEKPRQ